MIRLLLETATEVCSVAVARDSVLLAEHTALEAHQHSSHLTLFIRQVVEEAGITLADVNEIVLSDGPGSYTSLRVGAATAKGLCMALPGLQLRVVSTLLALAHAAEKKTADAPVLAVLNSRRGEVYGQLFGPRPQVPSLQQEAMEESLWDGPQNIRLTEPDWHSRLEQAAGSSYLTVCGPGQSRVWQALEELNEGKNYGFTPPEHCSAIHLLAPASAPGMSRIVDLASYEPFYLNPPFVTKSKKKLLGR